MYNRSTYHIAAAIASDRPPISPGILISSPAVSQPIVIADAAQTDIKPEQNNPAKATCNALKPVLDL